MITNSVVEGTPPFVGTRPFGIEDDHIFFGRDREIREVAGLWRGHRLTLLHGGAGVGKTSLVCAGVIPRLRAEGEHVLPLGHLWRRNAYPAAAFPAQNVFTLALLSSWHPSESPTRVAGLSVLDFLRRRGSKDRFGLPVRTFAAIDHADLLFRDSVPHRRQRRRFLDQLVEAMNGVPDLHLLLAAREEHLDELRALGERLAGDTGAAYALGAFDRAAAVQAVRRPLDGTGRSPGPDTVEALVDELRTIRTPWAVTAQQIPTVAPAMLQLVCARLWADLAADPAPTAERLAADVGQVLAEFCGQALATVAADHRRAPGEIVSWFRATFAGRGGAVTARHAGAEAPGAEVSGAVLRAVEDLHLIRVARRDGNRLYELHHPRMIEPVRTLGARPGPVRRLEPAERLREAERALSEGAGELARHHAEAVVRACGKGDLRTLAEAERLLGNIACEHDRPETAAEHYRSAASVFEVLQDTRAVGLLLAALGRLLMDGSAAEAVRELRTAANRLPNDLVVQVALAQALWQAGRTRAALAVLDTVLTRDGDTPEALRARGEMLADLGHAEPALRDLRRVDHHDRASTHAAWVLAETSRRPGPAGAPEGAAAGPEGAETGPEAVLPASGRGEVPWPDPGGVPVENVESGPVLLRVARTHRLRGQDGAAAGLAARALAARRPPLPPQLRDEAFRLMGPGPHGDA
ncbi:tetratricopeptide repeat protein [Actinomadura viridis]|uniref:nSTAND1 domain-containing NTPase n=1 Tax=Actinomadura viridis TaxID=58110 RepID=UPI0036B028D6